MDDQASESRTRALRSERARATPFVAYQQRRRSLSANAAGAGSATHLGTIRHRLRSATLGAEAGRTRREEREGASDRRHRKKARGAAASPVGERRSVRTIAQ